MICKPCGEAGDTLAIAREIFGPLKTLTYDVIRLKHQECEGCDCQHKLGPAPRTV